MGSSEKSAPLAGLTRNPSIITRVSCMALPRMDRPPKAPGVPCEKVWMLPSGSKGVSWLTSWWAW